MKTKESQRIIVKIGTNVLTNGTDSLNQKTMSSLAAQIATLIQNDIEVILITSGAIAAGRHKANSNHRTENLTTKDVHSRQVLAAVGQAQLMRSWDEIFQKHSIIAGQALLTRNDLNDRAGYLNARNTLTQMLSLKILPIINENDVVSIEEIDQSTIGDNDYLSAQVANLVDADLLLILTDTEGLFSENPHTNNSAYLIETVEKIDDTIIKMAGKPSDRGTGGMSSKIIAARLATQHGAYVIIAHGHKDSVIIDASNRKNVGTLFLPTGDRTESKRRYLMSGLQVQGRIIVDDGAVKALQHSGTSLLPAGVLSAEGNFLRGSVVEIYSDSNAHIATGIVNYDLDEIEKIAGKHSDDISKTLGYAHSIEIIHRNNLILI
ncbi:MAG: glutamate 5-kinase [Dehalococcoidia bacterium]|nr:glutamate 5-kinase [Dehalococcoidia bacterium]